MINCLQRYLPVRVKMLLKPYFRTFFPNKLIALLWITFRCSYKCSYCPYCGIQDYSYFFPKNVEKTGEEWIEALESLPPTSFYILGGEPFLYKDLYKIINNLPKKHSIIGIITNASMPIEVYNKINKKLHINISFHREFVSEEDFINKVLLLSKKFHVTVNIVANNENILFLKNHSKDFKNKNISVHVDPFIDFEKNKCFEYTKEQLKMIGNFITKDRNLLLKTELENLTKICSAGRNYYNIMPNGDVTICSNTMDIKYSKFREKSNDKSFDLGNIFDGTFKLNNVDYKCKYKCLNHCDIDYCKIKIERYGNNM